MAPTLSDFASAYNTAKFKITFYSYNDCERSNKVSSPINFSQVKIKVTRSRIISNEVIPKENNTSTGKFV